MSNAKRLKPKVFISYSGKDSGINHVRWVENFIERLAENRINVHWDNGGNLKRGHDLDFFMERMISTDHNIKRILPICDHVYKAKADNREGGVGNEIRLMSSQLRDPLQEKIIPIIRERDEYGKPCLPACMSNLVYFDFSSEEFNESEFKKLIKDIHKR